MMMMMSKFAETMEFFFKLCVTPAKHYEFINDENERATDALFECANLRGNFFTIHILTIIISISLSFSLSLSFICSEFLLLYYIIVVVGGGGSRIEKPITYASNFRHRWRCVFSVHVYCGIHSGVNKSQGRNE